MAGEQDKNRVRMGNHYPAEKQRQDKSYSGAVAETVDSSREQCNCDCCLFSPKITVSTLEIFVRFDVPKVAVSVVEFGTVSGIQFAGVFQSPLVENVKAAAASCDQYFAVGQQRRGVVEACDAQTAGNCPSAGRGDIVAQWDCTRRWRFG